MRSQHRTATQFMGISRLVLGIKLMGSAVRSPIAEVIRSIRPRARSTGDEGDTTSCKNAESLLGWA